MDDLILEREANGNVPTGVVAIDVRGPGAAIQISVDKTDASERDEVEPVIQSEVVFPDSGKRNLKEIAGGTDLHHRSERKVPIGIIVDIESEGEDGSIDRAGRQPKI